MSKENKINGYISPKDTVVSKHLKKLQDKVRNSDPQKDHSTETRIAKYAKPEVEIDHEITETRLDRLRKRIKSIPPSSDLIEKSRDSRLKAEKDSENLNSVQRFFGWGVVGFIARTGIQSIPSPIIEYGIGDVVTGISAIIGRDILSGEKLDVVDRVCYGVATAIPYLPATILVLPIRELRKSIEEANHAERVGDTKTAIKHSQDAAKSVENLASKIRSEKK